MQWTSSFWGKHPAFADFIRINADDEMLYVLIQWLAKQGTRPPVFGPGGNGRPLIHFWLVLPHMSRLTCGLIMSSNDSQGRPAPALLAMKGNLSQKPDNCWERLSSCCLATWNDMSRLLTYGFDSVSAFREELYRLVSPDFETHHDDCGEWRRDEIRDMIRNTLARDKQHFIRDKMLCFTVDGENAREKTWLSWNRAIRDVVNVSPLSWFVRDNGYNQKMFLFYRPLAAVDFKMMVSV